jgi:hypothetical protein
MATPTGVLSVPKAKLAAILAASGTLQAWFGGAPEGPDYFFDSFAGGEFDCQSGDAFDALCGSVPDPLDKIFYSFLEEADAEQMAALRPFAVVLWDHFQMRQIAGGGRNLLWPRDPQLRVILTDNDPVQPEATGGVATAQQIIESDTIFENLLGGVIGDIANLAAVDDYLAITAIDLDMPLTRNPPKDWAAAGSYLWASFTVRYQ